MNKSYLLTICLFLTFFTGCIEDEESSDTTVIEETDDTTKNQDNETELVKGCTNSTAHNYNPNATDDDRSCKFDTDENGDTGQLQNASILSAYYGLDQLPFAASILCGFNVAGDDGMPVVFSTQLQVDSVVPESFLVIRSDGESVVPNCATLNPANEPLELRTVLLTGNFSTFGETPLRVEVTGPLLTFDGNSLFGVSTEDITPLEDGPRVVLAERFAPDTNGLAGECPDDTTQVVQLTWEGGVTGPASARLGDDQRLGTWVLLEDGAKVNPIALVDDDPDNHVLACLAEDSPAQSVEVHAGLFHDPGDVANPATQVEVTDEVNDVDEIDGCTDSIANNYNPNATDDDGTCDYGIVILYNSELIQNSEYDLLATKVCVINNSETQILLENIALEDNSSVELVISADGPEMSQRLISEECYSAAGDYLVIQNVREELANEDYVFELTAIDGVLNEHKVLGCTNSTANNYSVEATEDDGTCTFSFQPEDRDELKTAVDEWIDNSTSANSTYGKINTWDTSLITDMSGLFFNSYSFNGDISDWDVSSVTDMSYMFSNNHNFNQNLLGWNVSSVTNMLNMFAGAQSFNQDISDWDVSSVNDMYSMFYGADSFNQDISGWDVSSVNDMMYMFDNADSLSDDNKCYIHTEFNSNEVWEYDWGEYCSDD